MEFTANADGNAPSEICIISFSSFCSHCNHIKLTSCRFLKSFEIQLSYFHSMSRDIVYYDIDGFQIKRCYYYTVLIEQSDRSILFFDFQTINRLTYIFFEIKFWILFLNCQIKVYSITLPFKLKKGEF